MGGGACPAGPMPAKQAECDYRQHRYVDQDRPQLLGTTVDPHAVRRDAVLAGVFSGLNVMSGLLDVVWLLPGIIFGAMLGAVLHVLPAEPHHGDSRRGRMIIRCITGGIGGAWGAAAIRTVSSDVVRGGSFPSVADYVPVLMLGTLTGAAWYLAWGWWEMRPSAPRLPAR